MYGQFFVIFALMLTGYLTRKVNIISEEMNQSLNKFIIYVSFPCFIFYKVAGIEGGGVFIWDFMLTFIISTVLFLISGLYAFGYAKARRFPREDSGSAEIMMVFPNNAFMGFPISYIFFRDIGLLLMLANNIAMNLTLFSYGVFTLIRNDGGKRFSVARALKCLLNPNILALIAGLIIYYLKLVIPNGAGVYLNYIGSICTPMAMIYIGSTLVGTNILQVVKNNIIIESVINKNIILPVLSCLLLIFLPISGIMKAIIVFGSCFPSAAMASVLVETEGKNSLLACRILVVSTAVSIVSIPIFVKLINLIIL